ncbi:MAG: hypothetical protein NC827_04280 [Candidatus Omnitrophica bacterium]|nr:hypothetical protein [Candidatus Omnitrophota bacterium]MCM8802509.1 hypothetical protein [Candidatus Omnitrophota bacterium]
MRVFLIFFLFLSICFSQELFKIFPAKKKVMIDGDLKEWNKEGKFGPVYLDEELIETHSSLFYGMYDNENLYLACEVKDPDPMKNKGVPEVGVFWHGDSITLRICISPEYSKKDYSTSSEKDNPYIFHISFWHNDQQGKDYILIKNGMKYKDFSDEGIEVKFKKWEDGKGYNMEAKIPWKTLSNKIRPQPGDKIRWTMDTIWGTVNSDGCMFKAVALGDELNYQKTNYWGWAEFIKNGGEK